MSKKYILVEVTFFEDVRKTLPDLNLKTYRPHFVVKGDDEYLGVCFMEGDQVEFGKKVFAKVLLMYDGVHYEKLQPQTPFLIKEGGKTVGEGIVEEVL